MKNQDVMTEKGLENHKVCSDQCITEHKIPKPHITDDLSKQRLQYEYLEEDIFDEQYDQKNNLITIVINFIRSFC